MAAMKQCPSAPTGLPYISIILSGAVADEIAMPCTTNQDTCSRSKGMVCADLSITKPFGIDLFGIGSSPAVKNPGHLNDAFFSAMKFVGLYDSQDATPGCYSISSLVAGVRPSTSCKAEHRQLVVKHLFMVSMEYMCLTLFSVPFLLRRSPQFLPALLPRKVDSAGRSRLFLAVLHP